MQMCLMQPQRLWILNLNMSFTIIRPKLVKMPDPGHHSAADTLSIGHCMDFANVRVMIMKFM